MKPIHHSHLVAIFAVSAALTVVGIFYGGAQYAHGQISQHKNAKPADIVVEPAQKPKPDPARLEEARYTVDLAKRNALAALRDAYIKTDDAIRAKADEFFNKSFQVTLLADAQIVIDLATKRAVAETSLTSLRSLIADFMSTPDPVAALITAQQYTNQALDLLDLLALLVNSQAGDGTTQTSLRNGKGDIYTARTNVSGSTKSLITAESTLHEAQFKLSQLQ